MKKNILVALWLISVLIVAVLILLYDRSHLVSTMIFLVLSWITGISLVRKPKLWEQILLFAAAFLWALCVFGRIGVFGLIPVVIYLAAWISNLQSPTETVEVAVVRSTATTQAEGTMASTKSDNSLKDIVAQAPTPFVLPPEDKEGYPDGVLMRIPVMFISPKIRIRYIRKLGKTVSLIDKWFPSINGGFFTSTDMKRCSDCDTEDNFWLQLLGIGKLFIHNEETHEDIEILIPKRHLNDVKDNLDTMVSVGCKLADIKRMSRTTSHDDKHKEESSSSFWKKAFKKIVG